MKTVMWATTPYEDKLYVNGEYLGRIDTLTQEELLELLAKHGVLVLEKKYE
ncbi:hypothetical protein ACFVS2_25615 [Brevibacillus sp. NPDC058079]|uniref:hypothetical protein n=1 Tax=Brevibacillus sp. NPDC058079 TaxID=3346330 RepID=UPI0036F0C0A3